MRVLVAEDNQLNQQLMSLYMKRLGWDFKVVGDGLQAVEACRQESFDLILMDVDMPVLDGIEATRYIRIFNSYIPIIAITAYTDDAIRRETQAAGMNAFLAKPCSRNDIYTTASACMEIKEEKVA
ncbi:MAG: response regulator [Bacteroidetes bacterium]|nr:response regulator [Bacteroidota bacterium]